MVRKTITIIFIVLISLIIFIFWLRNVNTNIKSSSRTDRFSQILQKNLFEIKQIFQNFKQEITRFKSNDASSQEILTNQEMERLKGKVEENIDTKETN